MSAWWDTLMTVEKVLYCVAVPSTIILFVQTIMILFGAGGHEGYNPSDTSGLDLNTDFDVGHGLGGLHGDIPLGHDFGGLHGNMDLGHDLGGLHGNMDLGHDLGGLHGNMDLGHDFGGLHGNMDFDHNLHHVQIGHDGHTHPQDFDTLRIFTLQGMVAFSTIFSWSALAGIKRGVKTANAILIGVVMGAILMYIVALIIKNSKKLSEDGTFQMRDTLGQLAEVYIPIPPKNSGYGKVTVSFHNRYMEFNAVTQTDRLLKTGETVRIVDIVNDNVVVEAE